jgi:RNA polymerase sigma factor (TIGR02999 family)
MNFRGNGPISRPGVAPLHSTVIRSPRGGPRRTRYGLLMDIAQTGGKNRHSRFMSHDLGVPPSDDQERESLDELFSAAYEELRRLASMVRGDDRATPLQTTTLVNEAWLKLAAAPRFKALSHLHFKRIAARAMRQVLVEAARRRKADKRGGGDLTFVTFDESVIGGVEGIDDVLALDAALKDLARVSPRQAEMVECRFFGGLDVAETSELLEVSEATVLRDWRAAKAWLASELRRIR